MTSTDNYLHYNYEMQNLTTMMAHKEIIASTKNMRRYLLLNYPTNFSSYLTTLM